MLVGTALLLACAHGQAQPAALDSAPSMAGAAATSAPIPPGGIPLGPMVVYPAIDLSVSHNDNIFSSNLNKSGSTVVGTYPSLRAEAQLGPHRFSAMLRMEDVRFLDSPADNFTSYSLSGNADLVISGRAGLKVRAEYRQGIDPRGSTDRAASATPDQYLNQGIEGIFRYGAAGAQGRLEFDAASYSRRYENNRAATASSDRDTRQLGGTFLWRVAPKTELLGQVQYRSVDYALDTSTQSSIEMRYLIGAKWDATAKTTGIFKYGLIEKKFSESGRTDFSGSTWDGVVRWSPLTYSIFDFTTSKSTNESTGTGDFLLTQVHGVNWNHAWNSRFSTVVIANWRKDDFLGTGGGRVDKTTTLGLNATYQWQRWLRFGGSYTYADRISNPGTFDYTRHLWMLTVGATL